MSSVSKNVRPDKSVPQTWKVPGNWGSVHVCEPHTHTIRGPITC